MGYEAWRLQGNAQLYIKWEHGGYIYKIDKVLAIIDFLFKGMFYFGIFN